MVELENDVVFRQLIFRHAVQRDGGVRVDGDGRVCGAAIVDGAIGPSLPATVVSVEYQGPIVRINLKGPAGQDLCALISDTRFFADPPAVGEAVVLSWAAEDECPLEA